jgi:hypothetical protein
MVVSLSSLFMGFLSNTQSPYGQTSNPLTKVDTLPYDTAQNAQDAARNALGFAIGTDYPLIWLHAAGNDPKDVKYYNQGVDKSFQPGVIRFNLAWGCLMAFPSLLAIAYLLIAAKLGGTEPAAAAMERSNSAGFDMYRVLWSGMCEAPVFIFFLLCTGERRLEVLILVWLSMISVAISPSLTKTVRRLINNYKALSRARGPALEQQLIGPAIQEPVDIQNSTLLMLFLDGLRYASLLFISIMFAFRFNSARLVTGDVYDSRAVAFNVSFLLFYCCWLLNHVAMDIAIPLIWGFGTDDDLTEKAKKMRARWEIMDAFAKTVLMIVISAVVVQEAYRNKVPTRL